MDFEDEDIVVLLEDNMKATGRLNAVQRKDLLSISHVNCGLLPSSEASWETALEAVNEEGWLHLHENVGVDDISSRKIDIKNILQRISDKTANRRQITAENVELVKTFAPGVWHCVFDVYISRLKI